MMNKPFDYRKERKFVKSMKERIEPIEPILTDYQKQWQKIGAEVLPTNEDEI